MTAICGMCSVFYKQPSLDSEASEFLDPNKLSPDGTISISSTAFSEDGRYFAYGLSEGGSDWITVHVCHLVNIYYANNLIVVNTLTAVAVGLICNGKGCLLMSHILSSAVKCYSTEITSWMILSIDTLTASSSKHNVMFWRPSSCLSVLFFLTLIERAIFLGRLF